MPWYYYSGSIVRSIQVSDRISVAVRPHSKVEIDKTTKETQLLINSGLLRRTGGAKDSEKRKVSDLKIQDVLPKSDLAKAIAEKGVTSSMSLPPKKPVGAPEMTEGEISLPETESIFVEKADVLSTDEPDEGRKRRKRKRDGGDAGPENV